MNETCQQFRSEFLRADARQGGLTEHLDTCDACQEWLLQADSSDKHRDAFAQLASEPLEAPAELAERVALELRFDSPPRIERILGTLGGLEVLSAPPELDDLVRAELAESSPDVDEAKADTSLGVQALKTLTCHPAPAVLDRLVAEELEQPEMHRANRFSDLERMRAPDQLAVNLEKSLQRSFFLRRLGPLVGALAAAALLLWFTVGRLGQGPRQERPFEVVRSESIEAFHPWIQASFGALTGPRPQVQAPHIETGTDTGKEIR